MGIVERVPEEKGELGRFIILLANANDEPIRGRMKLQKMMCFLSRRVGEGQRAKRLRCGQIRSVQRDGRP